MKRLIITLISPPLIFLFFAGCTFLAPRRDPSRFFTLSPLQGQSDAPVTINRGMEQVSLGIRPIKFPLYLDREQLVSRSAQNRLEISENDRWAEPLEENFTRVLLQNLSALLPAQRIVAYPWPSTRNPDYQLEIEVLRFESNNARDAQLLARWMVIDPKNRKTIAIRESRLTRPAKERSVDATVAALSETVGDLSRQIADAVGAIESKSVARPSTDRR